MKIKTIPKGSNKGYLWLFVEIFVLSIIIGGFVMKRLSIGVVLGLLMLCCFPAVISADTPIKLVINGQVSYPNYQIIDNRTFLPLAFVSQQLGAEVDWNSKDQVVTFMKGNVVAQVKIGSNTLYVNGNSQNMDVSPIIINNKTMLPISYVANALGYSLNWDAGNNTITINGSVNTQSTSSDPTTSTNDKDNPDVITQQYQKYLDIWKIWADLNDNTFVTLHIEDTKYYQYSDAKKKIQADLDGINHMIATQSIDEPFLTADKTIVGCLMDMVIYCDDGGKWVLTKNLDNIETLNRDWDKYKDHFDRVMKDHNNLVAKYGS